MRSDRGTQQCHLAAVCLQIGIYGHPLIHGVIGCGMHIIASTEDERVETIEHRSGFFFPQLWQDDRHTTRCLRHDEIDWDAPMAAQEQKGKTEIGDVVLKIDDLRKYYEVAASALFSSGPTKVVKANETLSFEAREGETLAIVGESGCGKSTFAKVLMGLETAEDGFVSKMPIYTI